MSCYARDLLSMLGVDEPVLGQFDIDIDQSDMSDVVDDDDEKDTSICLSLDLSDSDDDDDDDNNDNDDNAAERDPCNYNFVHSVQDDTVVSSGILTKKSTAFYRDNKFFMEMLNDDDDKNMQDAIPCIDYFRGYINQDFITEIVRCTNLKSIILTGKCIDVTANEIETFIGINFLMSIMKLPKIELYWRGYTHLPVIAHVMTEDRFIEIGSCLKVQDDKQINEDMKKKDRLWKIRPILEEIRKRCGDLPRSAKASIYENSIPLHKLHNEEPGKPILDELKMHILTSSEGLILDFEILQGKEKGKENLIFILEQLRVKPNRPVSLAEAVVLRFILSIDPGTSLFLLDKHFTSNKLLEELVDRGINGTRKINKKLVPEEAKLKSKSQLRMEGHGAFDVQVRCDRKIIITSWYCEDKVTYFASNNYAAVPEDTCLYWFKSRNKCISVKRPYVVREYNDALKRMNEHKYVLNNYRSVDGTRKWTTKSILYLLDLVAVNSWVEYKLDVLNLGDRKYMQYPDFKITLALQMLGKM